MHFEVNLRGSKKYNTLFFELHIILLKWATFIAVMISIRENNCSYITGFEIRMKNHCDSEA